MRLTFTMKTKTQIATAVAVANLIITISSCASSKINLLDDRTLALQLVPSESAYMEHVNVKQLDSELVVSGHVSRLLFCILTNHRPEGANMVTVLQYEKRPLVVGGHMDIAVVAPDGSILNKVSVPYHPRTISVIRSRPSSFRVRIPVLPPHDSIVRVAHHNVSYSAKGPFDCGENAALPNIKGEGKV